MAKVFPLFLIVVVLALSVLLLAIPTQEQPANAEIYDVSNIRNYQDGNLLHFCDIPRTGWRVLSNGFEVIFDVNTSYKPFDYIMVYSDADNPFEMFLDIEDGYLLFYSQVPYYDLIASTPFTYPYKLEIYFSSYFPDLYMNIRYNHKLLYKGRLDYDVLQGNLYNVGFIKGYGFVPLSEWIDFNPSLFLATLSLKPVTSSVAGRDWTDYNQASYDAGYVDGMNEANDAKASLFPSIIGSIFAFFVSIASYEVLGISLLNIMIVVGSVLLLLAVLRVFLK